MEDDYQENIAGEDEQQRSLIEDILIQTSKDAIEARARKFSSNSDE